MAFFRRVSRQVKLVLLLLACLALCMAFLRLRKFTTRESEDLQDVASLEQIAEIAKRISRLGKPVLLNVFNNGFLQMTLNWLCHTQPMNIHQHVLLVTRDLNTTKAIKAEGYKVRVVTYMEEGGARVEGDQNFGQLGYLRLLATRARVLNATLQAGVEVIQFESDATWMVSPFPLTLTFANADGADLDLVHLSAWERPTEVPPGFLFLRPRPPVLALVHKDLRLKLGVFGCGQWRLASAGCPGCHGLRGAAPAEVGQQACCP